MIQVCVVFISRVIILIYVKENFLKKYISTINRVNDCLVTK